MATTKQHAGHGGKKGEAILAAIAADSTLTRKQVAELVGCTVARVGETCRSAGVEAAAGRKGKKLAELPLVAQTRSARCEHEKAKKIKTGSCKVCATFVAAAK